MNEIVSKVLKYCKSWLSEKVPRDEEILCFALRQYAETDYDFKKVVFSVGLKKIAKDYLEAFPPKK